MLNQIKRFFSTDASTGIILVIAAILAMIVANSDWLPFYKDFLHIDILGMSLSHVVNDGLMALFFLSIGLEVKEELIHGSLNSKEAAIFPLIAALGGMLMPAIIFLLFNQNDPESIQGWAIPAATDIAFALGILALLGDRVPTGLKVFLLALAIIDDLGVIIIIAFFYTSNLSPLALLTAFSMTLILFMMNAKKVTGLPAYLLVGFILWFSVLQSGVHATLAGVVLGFAIPINGNKGHPSPLKTLDKRLDPWVSFLILPLFAFVNAGVVLEGLSFSDLLTPVPLGVALGLVIGKPLGVVSFSYLAVKFNIANLPKNVDFKHIFAISGLCGIGFTMSIFIASLAFGHLDNEFENLSRLGILFGSTVAAILGYFALRWSLQKR